MADEEGKKLELTTTMANEECITCGIRFTVPDYYQRRRKEDHVPFHCPNGHNQYYGGTNDKDLVKKYKAALKEIAELEVGKLFNKDTLQLAIKTAQLALK